MSPPLDTLHTLTVADVRNAVTTALAWLLVTAERVWEKARVAWALAVATYRVAVVRRFMATADLVVYKVCAFDERGGRDEVVTRFFDASRWEESVRAGLGWAPDVPLRVEVRYLSRGRKYRLVLRPGDACDLPAPADRHRGGPKGVMAAELVGEGEGGEAVTVNVTRRLHKYEGPLKDFHRGGGLRVGVVEMFPFDDADELRHNFHTLRLVDAHARVLLLPVDTPDLAGAIAARVKAD